MPPSPEPAAKRRRTEHHPPPPPPPSCEAGADDPAEAGAPETPTSAEAPPAEEAAGLALHEADIESYEDQRERSAAARTYTSSIYVDAFNLVLDTVLADEAYLFSSPEAEAFAKYRSLDYEAQHL